MRKCLRSVLVVKSSGSSGSKIRIGSRCKVVELSDCVKRGVFVLICSLHFAGRFLDR